MKPKIIVTLGPATNTENYLNQIKDRGVDFVRVNMSHASLEDLKTTIFLAKKVGIPFIIDTQGSQIRSGDLAEKSFLLEENNEVKIHANPIKGDRNNISLNPGEIVFQLEEGDILRLDFNGLILKITDTATLDLGYIIAQVVNEGVLGRNKGVVVDSWNGRTYDLPALTLTDYQSIAIGLKEGIGFIAASFMRSGSFVEEVRRVTNNSMKIISKIECLDGLRNLDEIIEKSDYLLIDRGDLSKELPLEKIPFTQKIIIQRARKKGKGVIVATNLLETMINNKKPTRAEVHDVVNTIVDGAEGLALTAETAVGKYPIECINMLNRLINQVQENIEVEKFLDQNESLVNHLESKDFLLKSFSFSNLVPPHGGKLVYQIISPPASEYLEKLPKINLNQNQLMDVEQIALGTFSPLEGFLGRDDLESVLNTTRLKSGIIWPIPIVLDVSVKEAESLKAGGEVALIDSNSNGQPVAILHLEEKYDFDKKELAEKLYGTLDEKHPGVKMTLSLQPIFLAGGVDFFRRPKREDRQYELSPRQARQIFRERGWSTIVGFHTRNVIHRGHEFIQIRALEQEACDGLLAHPVVGAKKSGDFHTKYIMQSYQKMMEKFYPKNKVVLAAFNTYSRYAGPREALFTAICRKNFGCSHFIVGRDHTGVGNFYESNASQKIFDLFPDIGIKIVKIQAIYSKTRSTYISSLEEAGADEIIDISGTEARAMLARAEYPPVWYMRPEIAEDIIQAVKNGEEVFVP